MAPAVQREARLDREARVITLDEEQWTQMKARETISFVAAVCDQFLAYRPDMANAPGRDSVQARMQSARDFTDQTGFTSSPHVVQFMYTAADYPGFHDDALIADYLRKPGATPEQRFDDMVAVLRSELLAARGTS
jgi:hypothetical protein